MNYKKIYNNICERGKLVRNLDYSEIHHIIPKCHGGGDIKINLTTLSAKEHYLVHYLLTKCYPNDSSIYFAFNMMRVNNDETQYRKYSARQYSIMKKYHSEAMKLNNPMFDPVIVNKAIETRNMRYLDGTHVQRIMPAEERKQCSERMLGDNNPTRKFPDRHNFKHNKYLLGKHCYNNGVINKYFNPDDEIPEGFVRGNKPYKRIRNNVRSDHG